MTNIEPIFTALSDPTRRMIFERLAKKPLPVGELARGIPVTRPAVSQHLLVLKNAGLVTMSKSGTRNFYSIDPKGIEAMRSYLDKLWDRALANFKAEAERKSSHD